MNGWLSPELIRAGARPDALPEGDLQAHNKSTGATTATTPAGRCGGGFRFSAWGALRAHRALALVAACGLLAFLFAWPDARAAASRLPTALAQALSEGHAAASGLIATIRDDEAEAPIPPFTTDEGTAQELRELRRANAALQARLERLETAVGDAGRTGRP